ncbi:MAG TPA: Maf family protein [Pyrinomonadaceae bacterium]|nr:Maf family protein [Pyrinomonadaceae bacterium]
MPSSSEKLPYINENVFELPELILASASPRRAEILTNVGWKFKVFKSEVDETPLNDEKAAQYTKRLALAKAAVAAERFPDQLILAADTTVVIDEKIIGKPENILEAGKMLRMLSGRCHKVITAVALQKGSQILSAAEETLVEFDRLDDSEIEYLVTNGNPLDKAGAYAVQAQAALFIKRIEGDYWNVVGLPVRLVYNLYKKLRKSPKNALK